VLRAYKSYAEMQLLSFLFHLQPWTCVQSLLVVKLEHAGAGVGAAVVGAGVGLAVVGAGVGLVDGEMDGLSLGGDEGSLLGEALGEIEGGSLGSEDGLLEGI
jgi:hypothetical protein